MFGHCTLIVFSVKNGVHSNEFLSSLLWNLVDCFRLAVASNRLHLGMTTPDDHDILEVVEHLEIAGSKGSDVDGCLIFKELVVRGGCFSDDLEVLIFADEGVEGGVEGLELLVWQLLIAFELLPGGILGNVLAAEAGAHSDII